MAKKSKKNRVADEKERLLKIFSGLDENKLSACMALIERASYITVSLQELEDAIDKKGFTEEYQNGENQRGVKRTAEADLHIAMTKNLNAIIKQLLDIVPPAQKASKLAEMMAE